MKLKKDVSVTGIRPELLLALIVADGVYKRLGQELVVTSINDGRHSKTSLHYSGQAADLRTFYFDESEVPAVAAALREALGDSPDFDVVVESDHIHLEWQPKRRG